MNGIYISYKEHYIIDQTMLQCMYDSIHRSGTGTDSE